MTNFPDWLSWDGWQFWLLWWQFVTFLAMQIHHMEEQRQRERMR